MISIHVSAAAAFNFYFAVNEHALEEELFARLTAKLLVYHDLHITLLRKYAQKPQTSLPGKHGGLTVVFYGAQKENAR